MPRTEEGFTLIEFVLTIFICCIAFFVLTVFNCSDLAFTKDRALIKTMSSNPNSFGYLDLKNSTIVLDAKGVKTLYCLKSEFFLFYVIEECKE